MFHLIFSVAIKLTQRRPAHNYLFLSRKLKPNYFFRFEVWILWATNIYYDNNTSCHFIFIFCCFWRRCPCRSFLSALFPHILRRAIFSPIKLILSFHSHPAMPSLSHMCQEGGGRVRMCAWRRDPHTFYSRTLRYVYFCCCMHWYYKHHGRSFIFCREEEDHEIIFPHTLYSAPRDTREGTGVAQRVIWMGKLMVDPRRRGNNRGEWVINWFPLINIPHHPPPFTPKSRFYRATLLLFKHAPLFWNCK